jgi:hypothetical protein
MHDVLHSLYFTATSIKHFRASVQPFHDVSCSSKDFAKWGIVVSPAIPRRSVDNSLRHCHAAFINSKRHFTAKMVHRKAWASEFATGITDLAHRDFRYDSVRLKDVQLPAELKLSR